jgi:dihydrofolate reductase
MATLTYSMMVSLDGFTETADGKIDWITIDEEIHDFANEQMRRVAAVVYGRRMYDLMSEYWPTADADPAAPRSIAEYARLWREKPKIVFSNTLEQVAWNARLARDVPAELPRLRDAAGELAISGPTLASAFARLGAIDEYQLFVQPIILGRGKPFFPPETDATKLRLAETRPFGAGVVYLRYVTAR